ncbi:hypothetical protein FACS189459_4010 [Bacilli bacterium]|nr:hypothetical protein FACS189459_4010 [Bacilli bacterium]
MYGYQNATYGSIFTIIGLVYLYMPFMILPIFNVLNNMPSNLNLASMDLGRKPIDSFFYITIPYAKTSIMSGVSLVFLPSLTTVAVPQFLNNSPSGTMIGDIIVQEGSLASSSAISLARASTLSLVMCLVIVGGFSLIIFLKKIIKKIKSHEKI